MATKGCKIGNSQIRINHLGVGTRRMMKKKRRESDISDKAFPTFQAQFKCRDKERMAGDDLPLREAAAPALDQV